MTVDEYSSSLKKAYEIMRDKSEYWKARCEAAEEIIDSIEYVNTWNGFMPKTSEDMPERIAKWQQLKQKLPQRVIEGL